MVLCIFPAAYVCPQIHAARLPQKCCISVIGLLRNSAFAYFSTNQSPPHQSLSNMHRLSLHMHISAQPCPGFLRFCILMQIRFTAQAACHNPPHCRAVTAIALCTSPSVPSTPHKTKIPNAITHLKNTSHRRPHLDQIPIGIIKSNDLLPPAMRHQPVHVFHVWI